MAVVICMDFIRFSKDKQKLKELVENDSVYQNMEESAYDVAVAFAGATTLRKIKSEKEGNVDMCQAIREMMEDERNEGIQEGRKEGIEILIQTCKEFGASREETFTKIKTKFVLQEEDAQNYMQMYWREA